MIAKKRLYLTADKKGVVEEGDSRATSLLVSNGSYVPREFERLLKDYELGKKIKRAEIIEVCNLCDADIEERRLMECGNCGRKLEYQYCDNCWNKPDNKASENCSNCL